MSPPRMHRSPCFFGTTSCYDSPPGLPLHFVVLRSAVPPRTVADPSGSRRFLGSPLYAFAVLYDSASFFALSLEGRPRSGELPLAGGSATGASFRPRTRSRRLRSASMLPPGVGNPKAREQSHFRSSITRPSHSLSTLRTLPPVATVVGVRKTRFWVVANLCQLQGSNKVSVISST